MNMKPQNGTKTNKHPQNIYKAAMVQFELKKRGIKQRDIAKDLGITDSAVYRSLHGLCNISKVDKWVEENLGLSF